MGQGGITTAQTGVTLPLAYGFVRATGKKFLDYTAADTTIIQGYHLTEGELDGVDNAYLNNQVANFSFYDGHVFTSGGGVNLYGTFTLHFHPGTDTPLGSPFTPTSRGATLLAQGDQLLDQMWSLIPDVVNRLFFSRIAYYFISFKPAAGSTAATPTPVLDLRGMRCRIFDANGNQTGYGFTTNPAWHFVDTWLRRVIKPEYAIQSIVGADQLSSTEKACFDWGSIIDAANYYDGILANGRKRFEGSYAFANTTTLAAIQEQILLCCRSYQQEYNGKIYLMCDKPRPSTFLMSARHLVPDSIKADEKQVHASANRYVGHFLDIGVPVVAQIASISRVHSSSNPVTSITTVQANPCAANDLFQIEGVADLSMNGVYLVTGNAGGVISALGIGTSGYGDPSASSTGGRIGYFQGRFALRSPEINHRHAQLSAGQLPSSVAENSKRSSKTKVQYDFANCSYDQQNRLLRYEMIRDLGVDVSPWKPPITITLRAWSESVDSLLQVLKAQIGGDIITLDDTVTWEHAGDYEIIDSTYNFFNWQQGGDGAGSGSQSSGIIDLTLRTFDRANAFPDVSDAPTTSYATLPGDDLWAGLGPANSSYQVSFVSLTATDAGTSITDSIVGLQIRVAGGQVLTYADSSITNLPYSTHYYIFIDDPTSRGGSILIQATTDQTSLTSQPGRMFIAELTTPASGGSPTNGSGGGSGVPPPPRGPRGTTPVWSVY
jgi:prepilin-type processing-associated H-X9-DG protein